MTIDYEKGIVTQSTVEWQQTIDTINGLRAENNKLKDKLSKYKENIRAVSNTLTAQAGLLTNLIHQLGDTLDVN